MYEVEEAIVEEVLSMEPHVTVSAAAATLMAPAAGFHLIQESEFEATAQAEAPCDEQVEEEPIPVMVEETGDGNPLEVCYFFFSTSIA